jgi:hypothetical protein
MGTECSMHGERSNVYRVLVGENERDHQEELDVGG